MIKRRSGPKYSIFFFGVGGEGSSKRQVVSLFYIFNYFEVLEREKTTTLEFEPPPSKDITYFTVKIGGTKRNEVGVLG